MSYALDNSLLHLLHRASQIADDIFEAKIAVHNLTARQFVVLGVVNMMDGACQQDIASCTGIDRSTTADIMKRLE